MWIYSSEAENAQINKNPRRHFDTKQVVSTDSLVEQIQKN